MITLCISVLKVVWKMVGYYLKPNILNLKNVFLCNILLHNVEFFNIHYLETL